MTESLGELIRRLRLEQGLSQRGLAERAHVSKGHVSNVELGRFRVGPGVLAALGAALGVDLPTPIPSPYPGAVPTSDSVALVLTRHADGSVTVVAMDRRAFLAGAASAATAAAIPAIPLPDQVTPDMLTAVADRMEWHVEAGRVLTPNTMSRLLRADLDTITRASRNVSTRLRPGLLSLGARYAEYLGWLRQDAGDDQGALYWTNRAGDFAHAAGWRHMVSYTLTRKALITQHDEPQHAADLAHVARTGPWKITPGLALLAATQEADAYALAGRDREARSALDTARRALARVDPDDEPPIGPRARRLNQLLDMREARCELSLGQPERAIEHLAPVVRAATFTRWRATDGALLALAYARAGAVDDSCTIAYEAAVNGASCTSATAVRELRALRPALRPWAGRDDVDQVLAALPA